MTALAPGGPSRGTETYTFSSQPRSTAASSHTKKIAAPPSQPGPKQQGYGNIMYDRRVIRGNTYALHTLPAGAQPDVLELQRQEEMHRRSAARRRARDQARVTSPDAISGRKHMDIQTELYLEELTDRVEDADNFTQTDAFLDRPPTPLFIPAKTGLDVHTQIEEGDLFEFELESRPIIEVLVGKTIEQALLEVLEEEELSALREQQRQFEQKRHAETVETQRLEEQDRRRTHEKEKRMQQQREALLRERETAKKIAARAFAKSYLTDLVPSVFDALTAHGYFYDHVEREIVEDFIPWLMGEVKGNLDKSVEARSLLDLLIMDALGYNEVTSKPPESGGDQPPVTEGDQPPVSEGDQPPVTEGDQPPVSEGDQPPVTEGDQPPVTKGDQPPVTKGDQPPVTEGDQPPVTEGDQPPVSEGDQPPVTEGDQPPVTEGGQLPVTEGDQPPVTEGDQPPVIEGGQPPVTEGDQPPVTEGGQPPVTEGDQPPVTEGDQPPVTEGDEPPVTEGDQPPVTEEEPPVTEGDEPTITEGDQPPVPEGDI